MKLKTKWFALLAVSACVLATPSVAVAEGWFSDLNEVKDATLGDLLRNPRDYVDVEVRVKVYFDRAGEKYNPYYTRFTDVMYDNFSAWPIDARLYEKRDFERSYPFFFVSKRHERLWDRISGMDRITPLELTVMVREVFKGQPWIEVLDYSRESNGLREKNVRDIVAGDAFFLAGRYKDAKKHYYRAADDDYPDHVVAEVYRRLADTQFRLGTYYDARRSYRRAERAAPNSAVIKKGIAACDEMIRRKDGDKPTAGAVSQPAAHTVPTVADRRNDVDQIIETLEDAATVQEQVDRDHLLLEQRGKVARGEAVAVSGNEKAEEEKQAAVEETPAEGNVEEEPMPPTVEEPEPLPEQPEEEVAEAPVEEPAEEATEEPAEEATEQPAAETAEQPAEEDIEEPVEEETGTEEPTEEVAETETTEEEPAPEVANEEPDEEMAEADAEEGTVEPVVEEGMEQAPTGVVAGDAPETDIADDDQPIVFEADSGKGEKGEVIAPVPALVTEEEQEQTAEVVPVAGLSTELPRLPFFGCEGVTDQQLRSIMQEIRSNPGG
ncbi:MAG: hypothetical protein ACYSX0_19540 [Planctomycetota bacterium]|jgi:tetratricopeptide (TPR) repeat protein